MRTIEITSMKQPYYQHCFKYLGILLPAIAGLLWFVFSGGGVSLNPHSIDWMMKDDWHQHLLGWLFYRQDAWHFPPGQLQNFLYPVGTAIGFTDSLPWLAIFFKTIAKLLPVNFQYFGPWLGLCFALQGVFGALIVRLVSPRVIHQILGGILFTLAPPLLKRVNHPALCAHWIILAMIWFHLRPYANRKAVWRTIGMVYALNLFCAGIHPYLALIACLLTIALFIRWWLADRLLKWKESVPLSLGIPIIVLFTFYLTGFLSQGVGLGSHGFGSFSADTLTLFNSMGWSRLIPPIGNEFHQYEGFAYLGLGVLAGALFIGASSIPFRKKIAEGPWRQILPMGLAVLLLSFFSFSSVITVIGKPVLKLHAFYAPIQSYVEPFRASGRFIWPLHYLWVASVVVLIPWLWSRRPRLVSLILLALVGIQLVDITPKPGEHRWHKTGFRPLSSPAWSYAMNRYHHLVLYPAEVDLTPCLGPQGYRADAVTILAYQAYRLNMTFNSGDIARRAVPNDIYCTSLNQQISIGKLDPQSVYITWSQYRDTLVKAGATCGVIDGTLVCVRPNTPDAFVEFLKKHPS